MDREGFKAQQIKYIYIRIIYIMLNINQAKNITKAYELTEKPPVIA